MKTLPTLMPTGPSEAENRPKTWAELETHVRIVAAATGEDAQAAVLALRKNGILVRLICSQLGIQKPQGKPGRRVQPSRDNLLVAVVDALKRDYGLKGAALWERAHHELATDRGFMGENQSNEPGAIARKYYRLRQLAKK